MLRFFVSGAARRVARAVVLLAVVSTLAAFSARSQEEVPDTATAEPDGGTAPVVVDGIELFRVRGSEAFPAKERAEGIARTIVAVARDPSIAPSALHVTDCDLGPCVTAGDRAAMIVTAIDSDARREHLTQAELAAVYLRLVKNAVVSYRESREPGRLRSAVVWAVGATLLLAALWIGLRWLFRLLDRVIARWLGASAERLRIRSMGLLSLEQTLRMLRGLLRGARLAAMLVLLYAYLNSTLRLFPWTRGLALRMLDLIVGPLVTLGRGAVAAIPDLAFLVVLWLVTRVVLRVVRLLFFEIDRGAIGFEHFYPEWAMPTYRLVRILIVAFAVVIAFPYIPGSSTGAFRGVSLFVGVLVSLGSSSVVGNIIAGYTVVFRRTFQVGDRIRVGDVVGTVTELRLLVTSVRTIKNEEVSIPNSAILASSVVNYSAHVRRGGLILHTSVGLGYEVPWRQVEAMLLLAAERTEGLSREPSPFVLQTALGDFAVTYQLNAYCEDPQRSERLYAEMHRRILDVFNEHGVQIMTPAYMGDPSEPKVVPRARWHAPPAEPTSDSS